jgi:hypothetical protein
VYVPQVLGTSNARWGQGNAAAAQDGDDEDRVEGGSQQQQQRQQQQQQQEPASDNEDAPTAGDIEVTCKADCLDYAVAVLTHS